MPTNGVAQWTCAISNLGFIYIYGQDRKHLWDRLIVNTLSHFNNGCDVKMQLSMDTSILIVSYLLAHISQNLRTAQTFQLCIT